MGTWSDEAGIMFHPLSTYRQLAAEADKGAFRLFLHRPLLTALVLGAFVSFTTSGRLTLPLVLEGVLFWGFVPILQLLLMAAIVLTLAPRRISMPKVVDLFFMGYGPCLLWMLGIAATCLFVPLKQIYLWPTEAGWIMPLSLLGMWLWSNVITFAFLRGALNLTGIKAAAALLLYTILSWGIILSYLFLVETLQLHRLKF